MSMNLLYFYFPKEDFFAFFSASGFTKPYRNNRNIIRMTFRPSLFRRQKYALADLRNALVKADGKSVFNSIRRVFKSTVGAHHNKIARAELYALSVKAYIA